MNKYRILVVDDEESLCEILKFNFEKEGYETTYSDWLPVPPPQLEVNIAMKQNVQPNVQSVHAYQDAIEIQFDKYMLPELLTTDNIIVIADTTIISGSIEMLDKELCYEGLTEEYVSKIRLLIAGDFDVIFNVKPQP